MTTALVAEAFFGQGFFRTLIFIGVAFLWGFALYDLAKSRTHGWSKAIWLLVIILLPILGPLVYLATRPSFVIETNPIDEPGFQGREREEAAVEMTHRTMS